jgi:hypothetical protein
MNELLSNIDFNLNVFDNVINNGSYTAYSSSISSASSSNDNTSTSTYNITFNGMVYYLVNLNSDTYTDCNVTVYDELNNIIRTISVSEGTDYNDYLYAGKVEIGYRVVLNATGDFEHGRSASATLYGNRML